MPFEFASEITKDSTLAWKAGRLKYKLHSDQRMVYDLFQAWKAKCIASRAAGQELPGDYSRVWVTDCSRRWGKDVFGLTILEEEAIRRPGANLMYATALQKDIGDIIIPLHEQLSSDCPYHLRGQYKESYKGQAQGIYFPNGSAIKLVGIDLHPDRLRGRGSDGMVISEAAFCSDLDRTVESVLLPQFLGRPHAVMIMNSTPPEEGAHPWDEKFCPDAKDRGAYVKRTIWNAPQYSDAEKREMLKIREDGTIPDRQQREFLCERIRENTKVVLPEFDRKIHVSEFEIPEYAHAYTVIDPAVQDLCAINFCVWDFINHRLLIVDEFTKRNANTNELVDVIREKELKLWNQAEKPLRFWNGKMMQANPASRVSDVDLRMIQDMHSIHGLKVHPSAKDDKDAALHALRNAFQQNKILIHPRCVNTIEHCLGATWNKARSSYTRSDRLGHCDHVDALVYIWRHIPKSLNPFPPYSFQVLQKNPQHDKIHFDPNKLRTSRSLVSKLNEVFSSRYKKR